MRKIVSNASPLIYLAKASLLSILLHIYDEIQIPMSVKIECVDEGLRKGYIDAAIIKKYIDDGVIRVHNLDKETKKRAELISRIFDLEVGESEVISLAINKGENEVLIDEKRARKVAKLFGLTPRGTLYLIFVAVKNGFLSKKEAIKKVNDLIDKNFRIDIKVYRKFLELLEAL